ncbi:hypothetical protein PR048_027549 [Dryococelus australis]|uniref:Uncharacterized protein n=1 Tax=Dryococelus australis TaxID=614101 RepID=A0ABQ9GGV0_9NEOP|nr:hypothetical protein PR048_027549 [Dryococelus australis]
MKQRRNEKAGETGDPRENPPTSGIVQHDSRMRMSGSGPAGDRARFALVEGEQGVCRRDTAPARRPEMGDVPSADMRLASSLRHHGQGVGERGNPRENPPNSGIVPHAKIRVQPRRKSNPARLGGRQVI